MRLKLSFWPKVMTLLVASIAVLAADTSTAYAQSNSCSRLQSSLNQLSRSSDFQNLQSSGQGARQLQGQVQAAESAYVRNGCNDDARAGRTLSRECQGIGRDVLRLRQEFQNASASVNTGNAMAQQREAILQELARFGCGTEGGSQANVQQGNRQNLFDRIFGNSPDPQFQDGEVFEDNTFRGFGGRTVRTVCVRLTDGYFWPISYSTLPEYAAQDAVRCSEMCPGTQVELYMYDNPGQEPEQMRSMTDQPYTALPTAFRYRETIDMDNSCTAPAAAGGTVATTEGGRAVASYNGVSFPLPLRDPRRQQPVAAAVAVAAADPAQFIDIPLPRRRPAGPGEAPLPEPVAAEAGEEDMRLVKFGDRTVRIVGPDTPYAQAEPAGT